MILTFRKESIRIHQNISRWFSIYVHHSCRTVSDVIKDHLDPRYIDFSASTGQCLNLKKKKLRLGVLFKI